MKVVKKVLVYITRKVDKRVEVLVFDHPGAPEVNPQVIAGTIEEGEEPKQSILREIYEESGLSYSQVDHFLGCFKYKAEYKNEVHLRHVFTIDSSKHQLKLLDKWSHQVKSTDSGAQDDGETFDFYWLPLEEAKKRLVVSQGTYLPRGNNHIINKEDICAPSFNHDLMVGGEHSAFSHYFDLKNIAAHYFCIPSGYRSSEPHAESLEEEFVYVISGEIDLWYNGRIKKMIKGDCIGFPAGTGIGHCFINNYDSPCEIFVSGDRTKRNNKYYFHLDPDLKNECGDNWWDDMPIQELGGHNGLAGEFCKSLIDSSIPVINAFSKIPKDSYSYPGDDETFTNGICLSRLFGMKNIAIWLEKMPSGVRSAWPHAHSHEEEFVFILDGTPDVVLDDIHYKLEAFDGVDFKAGSRVSHTLVNNSDNDAYYLCVGECDPKEDKIFYPHHPERNKEMKEKGALWEED